MKDATELSANEKPISAALGYSSVSPAGPVERPLQAPPALFSRSIFGPTAVFTALAIGSGELVFWPGLVLPHGAGVLWLALFVVGLQWLINTEIARYSLATGESVAVAVSRSWPGWGIVLLLCTVVPWLWPGWARAGAQLLANATGVPERPLSVLSLVLCGLILATPKRVYDLVERIQSALLVLILLGVAALFTITVLTVSDLSRLQQFFSQFISGFGIGSLLRGAATERSGDFLALVGGLVFAGAGGILNLGYGLLICEKGFGMGKYSQPILGLRHSSGLTSLTQPVELDRSPVTFDHWRRWIGVVRREHALLFVGGNVFTMLFISVSIFVLLGSRTGLQGTSFLLEALRAFGAIGDVAAVIFVAVGVAIFFTSELGIIDVTSRLASGILYTAVPASRRIGANNLYHAFVWFEIIAGTALILIDPRQPFWFLVTSAVLNALAMAVYVMLVAVVNGRRLPEHVRPHAAVQAIMYGLAVAYLLVFVLIVVRAM